MSVWDRELKRHMAWLETQGREYDEKWFCMNLSVVADNLLTEACEYKLAALGSDGNGPDWAVWSHLAADEVIHDVDTWFRPSGAWSLEENPEDSHEWLALTEERQRLLSSGPYKQYLKSPEWQALRMSALARAGNRCQLCNSNKRLHVHHRTYERRGEERLSDLTVLCSHCHAKFHDKLPAPA